MIVKLSIGLDNPEKAGQIAELLAETDANVGVSAPAFAKMFGMSIEEAVVFLEWIKVRIIAAHLHSFHHSKITHWCYSSQIL